MKSYSNLCKRMDDLGLVSSELISEKEYKRLSSSAIKDLLGSDYDEEAFKFFLDLYKKPAFDRCDSDIKRQIIEIARKDCEALNYFVRVFSNAKISRMSKLLRYLLINIKSINSGVLTNITDLLAKNKLLKEDELIEIVTAMFISGDSTLSYYMCSVSTNPSAVRSKKCLDIVETLKGLDGEDWKAFYVVNSAMVNSPESVSLELVDLVSKSEEEYQAKFAISAYKKILSYNKEGLNKEKAINSAKIVHSARSYETAETAHMIATNKVILASGMDEVLTKLVAGLDKRRLPEEQKKKLLLQADASNIYVKPDELTLFGLTAALAVENRSLLRAIIDVASNRYKIDIRYLCLCIKEIIKASESGSFNNVYDIYYSYIKFLRHALKIEGIRDDIEREYAVDWLRGNNEKSPYKSEFDEISDHVDSTDLLKKPETFSMESKPQ